MRIRRDQEHRLPNLIGQVYDAALEPKLWATVGPDMARALNAPSTAILVKAPRGGARWLSRTANYSDDFARDYEGYYHRLDVRANRGATRAVGQVFTSQELIPEAELVRTEFYQDFARKTQSFHLVGTVFEICEGLLGVLGVHRPEGAPAFTEQDKNDVRGLLPHLKRALQVRQHLSRVGIERRAALDTLERTGVATLVVGRDGHVLYASSRAEEFLRRGDVVRLVGGKLVASRPREAARLAQLMQGAVDVAATGGGAAGEALTLERLDRLPITVLVAPFRPARDGFGAEWPAALVFIRDPERLGAAGSLLQGLFGLTVTEACIAAALCQGKSLDHITREHGISINTAKTHLKGILLKTGTRRQAELVAFLLRSVAVLGVAEKAEANTGRTPTK